MLSIPSVLPGYKDPMYIINSAYMVSYMHSFLYACSMGGLVQLSDLSVVCSSDSRHGIDLKYRLLWITSVGWNERKEKSGYERDRSEHITKMLQDYCVKCNNLPDIMTIMLYIVTILLRPTCG